MISIVLQFAQIEVVIFGCLCTSLSHSLLHTLRFNFQIKETFFGGAGREGRWLTLILAFCWLYNYLELNERVMGPLASWHVPLHHHRGVPVATL